MRKVKYGRDYLSGNMIALKRKERVKFYDF